MNHNQNNHLNPKESSNVIYTSYPQTSPMYSPMTAPQTTIPMPAFNLDANMMFTMPQPNLSAINIDFQAVQNMAYQQCPVGYTPLLINSLTGQVLPLETQYVAPMQVQQTFVRPEPEVFLPAPVEANERRSSEASFVSEGEETSQEREGLTQGAVQKKYAFRSKQRKIDKVRGMIKDHFELLGLFAAEKELVRGEDTVRVHVKTFPGLTKIQEALKEIEDHPDIQITRIACPFSKKNKKQKKGFIVYLKVATVEQKEMVQGIFGKYEEWLKNCVTARPRPMPLDLGMSKDCGLDLAPPVMVKVASGG